MLLMCIIDSPRTTSNTLTADSCLRFRTVGRMGWNHIAVCLKSGSQHMSSNVIEVA